MCIAECEPASPTPVVMPAGIKISTSKSCPVAPFFHKHPRILQHLQITTDPCCACPKPGLK